MVENRMIGHRYDGGKSPLGGRVMLHGDLVTTLLSGKDSDMVILPGACWETRLSELREIVPRVLGASVAEFAQWPPSRQDEGARKLRRVIEKQMRIKQPGLLEQFEAQRRGEHASRERERVHREILRPWALGPLIMERPQGSSLHHLLDYDLENTPGKMADTIIRCDDTQDIVVENDWARVVPAHIAGEWRLPFEHCCWEMRISGVRVLAFTEAADVEFPVMFLVYGTGGHWVCDDYRYDLSQDGMRETCNYPKSEGLNVEFRRVNHLARDQIRASCIVLDAGVCERHQERAPTALVRRARGSGRTPPPDHYVVRLLREGARHGARTHASATSAQPGERAAQRGHWRRGTWVHYDDPDSGQEQYANDGGFFVSRTWRRWHFAGDRNNIIEREYRL